MLLQGLNQLDCLPIACNQLRVFILDELNSFVAHIHSGADKTLSDHSLDDLLNLGNICMSFLADLFKPKSQVSLTQIPDLLLVQTLQHLLCKTEIAISLQLCKIFTNNCL